MKKILQPGIYFGLDEEVYHEQPYLSASGIKNLLVSSLDFWSRSWMNEQREDEEESYAKMLGKAYHKRILEGKAAFDAAYVTPFECDDEDVIDGGAEMRDWLKAREIKGYSGKKNEELAAMILEADPTAKLLHILENEYEAQHAGKIFLDARTIHKIELAARIIELHPALKYYFVGGQPEVTVIWYDEDYGIIMKARFDYLKIQAVNDLKTFANIMGKTIEKAVYSTMASYKYHIQGALYLRASDAMKSLIKAGAVHGAEKIDPEWLKALADAPEHHFNFLFQQKGPAPVSVGAHFSREDNMYFVGLSCISDAVERFKRNLEVFGTDPWIDCRSPIVLQSGQYPNFAMDI